MSAAPRPVDIPGFTFVRPLGAGGYADVLLYTQELPRRDVAVKVLRAAASSPDARATFEREANIMAALSTHPSIVTIHHAAIAAGGRPYLVMEYCSLPTLAARCRTRPLSVPEMLQTMVRLSGAVETAHRAGILHRDIKPANVLTTDYGWPALADFGIAGLGDEVAAGDGSGTIAWSAPEAVAGRGYDRRSDVYSLAATAWTVLAGAAPFTSTQGVGDVTGLIARVLRDPVPRLGRADVPGSLERLLMTALSKIPDERPQTASEFARGLQAVEQEMHLPITHLDILDDAARGRGAGSDGSDAEAADAESTFLSGSRPPHPDPAADEATVLASRSMPDAEEATVLAARSAPGEEATVLATRSARAAAPADPGIASAGAVPSVPAPVSAPDADADDTRLVASRAPEPADATVLVRGRAADAATPLIPVSAPSGRTARVPGDDVADRVYGVRSAALTPVVDRAPAVAAAPAAPPTSATGRPAAARRRRGAATIWIVAIGALAVVGGAAAALIALVTG